MQQMTHHSTGAPVIPNAIQPQKKKKLSGYPGPVYGNK
jgi:hypothetical protein